VGAPIRKTIFVEKLAYMTQVGNVALGSLVVDMDMFHIIGLYIF
jgi:hypothetical protein